MVRVRRGGALLSELLKFPRFQIMIMGHSCCKVVYGPGITGPAVRIDDGEVAKMNVRDNIRRYAGENGREYAR